MAQLQKVTTNDNQGLSAQDFVMGNPYTMSQSATVYNIEPTAPAVHQIPKQSFKHDSKKVQEESPSMIESKRWF